jgi:hypothetical protein
VTFEDNLNLAPSGFRRSEPLLSTTVTPDEAQPERNIFPWGFCRHSIRYPVQPIPIKPDILSVGS